MTMDLSQLAAEFPREAIHWRAQTLTRDGSKALALAYLDARDVMDRLDAVCGPDNWQSRYVETPKGRVLCEIGIYMEDKGEWVWKSDGAGNTAVEGEKGGISDSLKRAAVQWGIGRYLYRLDSVWAPCETYERDGKKHWKAWKGSPWAAVRGNSTPPQQAEKPPERDPRAIADGLINAIARARNYAEYQRTIGAEKFDAAWKWLEEAKPPMANEVKTAVEKKRAEVDPAMQAPPQESAEGGHEYA